MTKQSLPLELNASDFLAFVRSHEIAIIKVRTPLDTFFSKSLMRMFQDTLPGLFGAGAIDAAGIDFSSFLNQATSSRLGSPASGYYLFYKSRLVGHSAGSIDRGVVTFYGFFVGAITLAFGKNTQDFADGAEAFSNLLEDTKASEIYSYFIGLLEATLRSASGAQQFHVLDADVRNAFRFFGLPVGADIADVDKVWKKMLKDCHPDTEGGDSQVLNKIAAEVNRQHDIITNARKSK